MSFNRVALFISCLLLALGWAVTAQARSYSIVDGGGEIAIGGGLPLPAQVIPPGQGVGTVFPPLLIPVASNATVQATSVMLAQQKLTIPSRVLSTPAALRQVGLFAQNPTLYAVATNLGWAWPAAPAVLSTGARTGAKTTTWTATQGSIRYSSTLPSKFGGPAQFAIAWGSPTGLLTYAPVTIYAVAVRPAGNPPCTHPALIPPFGGTYSNPACVAALAGAFPNSLGQIGAAKGSFASTSPIRPNPGIGVVKAGTSPVGTITYFTYTGGGAAGFTNMASSYGFPWTAGKLTIMMVPATGAPETFTITGKDNRTPLGAGTIQLVAGSLSNRFTSGPNANRGWVKLRLCGISQTPTMSRGGLAATAGLMLLAVAYVVRRRLSA